MHMSTRNFFIETPKQLNRICAIHDMEPAATCPGLSHTEQMICSYVFKTCSLGSPGVMSACIPARSPLSKTLHSLVESTHYFKQALKIKNMFRNIEIKYQIRLRVPIDKHLAFHTVKLKAWKKDHKRRKWSTQHAQMGERQWASVSTSIHTDP